MKKNALIAIYLIFVLTKLHAQIPSNFKYQAVVRNSAGEVLINKPISLKISIIPNSAQGIAVYAEVFENITTNDFGIVSVEIGRGSNVVLGSFPAINWSSGIYFMQVELDITGGNSFIPMGTSQIQAVPYALYALDVKNNDDADADPTNEIQDLQLIDNELTITKNSNATSISLAPYIGVDTDQQTLSSNVNNNVVDISIVRGNTTSFNLPSDFVKQSTGGDFAGPIHATNIVGNGTLTLNQNFSLSGIGSVLLNSTGPTNLTLPISGILATENFVNQSVNNSKTLATGNIWVGNASQIATPLVANNNGYILIGNGSTLSSLPVNGDASINGSGVLTLSNIGSATSYKTVNIDSKGRVIGGSNPNTLAGFGILDGLTSSLSNGNIYVGNSSNIASQVTLSGDASLSNSGVLTLNATTVVPGGPYYKFYVDSKGRITQGEAPTTLSGFGILDGLQRNLLNRNIFIGNSSNLATQVEISGDATLASNGILTLTPTTISGYRITDAMTTSHPANAITVSNITNWNSAYSWGNHSGLYRPIAYVPSWAEILSKPTTIAGYGITNAMTTAHPANAITASNITNWTTAFGWGNHASAGYLTSYTENDPIFIAWNRTTGISISASQVTDFQTNVTNNTAVLANTAKNSYPTADATKLSGIAPGAEVNVNADWNASSGDAQIINKPTTVSGYSISDAMTTAHAANVITVTNIANWNAAYAWGNHTGLYRQISYVPTWVEITGKPTTISGYNISDAMTTSHPANAITVTNIANWTSAYGWGDHASAGYQTLIAAGTTTQYYRGDKSWQTLDKSAVGLANVENTALTTWTGSSSIATVGTVTAGTWQGSVIGNSYINWAAPGAIGSLTPTTASFTTVNVSNIVHLTPLGAAPSGNDGDLYASTDGNIYFYTGGAWHQILLVP